MIHRSYNESYIENDSFIKLSQEDRLFDEISYYKTIQNYPQKYLFAEYKGDRSNGLTYALELQNYENYLNFAQFCFSESQANIIREFKSLLGKLKYFHLYPDIDIPEKYNCDHKHLNEKMFIDKTYSEFLKFKNDNSLCSEEFLIINGQKYKNFENIWGEIESIIRDNLDFKITFIHGDLCFSNIILDPTGHPMYFVDPRGSYGLKGCFGDKAYDYAKLLHSIEGNYEQIIYDLYALHIDGNVINYTFQHDLSYLLEELGAKISQEDLVKSKLIQGLIFIGMCARHSDSSSRQAIMYATGVKILNDILL